MRLRCALSTFRLSARTIKIANGTYREIKIKNEIELGKERDREYQKRHDSLVTFRSRCICCRVAVVWTRMEWMYNAVVDEECVQRDD